MPRRLLTILLALATALLPFWGIANARVLEMSRVEASSGSARRTPAKPCCGAACTCRPDTCPCRAEEAPAPETAPAPPAAPTIRLELAIDAPRGPPSRSIEVAGRGHPIAPAAGHTTVARRPGGRRFRETLDSWQL